MNEEFAVLKGLVPACHGVEMHKLAILQASIEYVRYLEGCVKELQIQAASTEAQTPSLLQPQPQPQPQQSRGFLDDDDDSGEGEAEDNGEEVEQVEETYENTGISPDSRIHSVTTSPCFTAFSPPLPPSDVRLSSMFSPSALMYHRQPHHPQHQSSSSHAHLTHSPAVAEDPTVTAGVLLLLADDGRGFPRRGMRVSDLLSS